MEARFSAKTVLVLAQRAAYRCSNPDCKKLTVGPNSEHQKATIIGEAAHIFGANHGSARFEPSMSDHARAEITNGIWLCASCHTLIDKDAVAHPASLLFKWKELHDRFVASELGNISEQLRFEERISEVQEFSNYPPIVKRIVMDRPPGWEWSLSAALLRHICAPEFRKLHDLRKGLYTRPLKRVRLEEIFGWVSEQSARMSSLMAPLEGLVTNLNESWGEQGQPGDLREIHHVCLLIHDYLKQVVLHEEEIKFVHVEGECLPLVEMLRDVIAKHAEKISELPEKLDYVVSLIDAEHDGTKDNPLVITHTLEFRLPDGWSEQVQGELARLEKVVARHIEEGY